MNKKILNATAETANNIKFKSRLEVMVYKTLQSEGFKPLYEPKKFTIWKGFYPSVSFYDRDNKTKNLKYDNKKLLDITYTPDFIFDYKGKHIIIEVKGFENDVFPVKKKLFRGWLEKHKKSYPSIYCEIFTKKQLLEFIKLLKDGKFI